MSNNWHDRAADALEAAHQMAAGQARTNALTEAGKLRNAADMYGLFFGRESSATKPTVSVGMNTERAELQPTAKD